MSGVKVRFGLIRSQAEDVPEAAGNEISPDPDDAPFVPVLNWATPLLLSR
jgi:hypothetical protein